MATIFEKTMQACREAKALTEKSNKKTAKSNLTEKKIADRRIKKESDEEDDIEMDVADDIVAVIDPDIDADEMTSVAAGFQQLVDDAGANEIPETDEYIDDHIYGCPICGNKFFSETPMTDGDKCPVCGEEANGFVLVGEVASDEEATDEEKPEDAEKSDEDTDDVEFDDTFDFDGEEIDVEVKGDVEKEDESKKARKENKALSRPTRRVRGENTRRSMRRRTESNMNLDDISFNKYLNRFVRENYENARSFTVKSATKNGNTLKIEGKIAFKSGKTKPVVLTCNYKRGSRVMLARDNGAFKVESKNAPFMFKVRTIGNVIKCEGMKYNFKTTAKIQNEDKKVAVHGSYLGEAKRSVSPSTSRLASARVALEGSKRVARRPMARRVSESRRIARKPMARRSSVRTMESRRVARRPLTRSVAESRRIARRPARRVESTRTARRVTRTPMSRVSERRITRRPSVRRSESVRATRRTVRPTRRVESRRNASRRIARR